MQRYTLEQYIELAKHGTKASIGNIMQDLNKKSTLAQTKFIDYALSHVESEEGIDVMKHYLFHGTQMQRNYAALYFGRLGEYLIVRQAYDLGLLDAKQAFSR